MGYRIKGNVMFNVVAPHTCTDHFTLSVGQAVVDGAGIEDRIRTLSKEEWDRLKRAQVGGSFVPRNADVKAVERTSHFQKKEK